MNIGTIERDNLEALLVKMRNLCDENSFSFSFKRGGYPIEISVGPDGSMDAQISMLDHPTGYNNTKSVILFQFFEGGLSYKISDGFVVDKSLLNKLTGIALKIHYAYLQVFYTDTLSQQSLFAMGGTSPTAAQDNDFDSDAADPIDDSDFEE